MSLTRRQFLAAAAAALGGRGLAACRPAPPPEIAGEIVGAAHKVGHLLRGGKLPPPSGPERRVGVLIAGAGIAGLSAAWKLRKSGWDDFEICDLEDEAGGNSRAGRNATSAYPWAAHYLPFPGPDAKAVHELLRELKVEIGRDAAGAPIYEPRYVRFAPAERLFIHGRWRAGLYPASGASAEDRRQLAAFEREMARCRGLRGRDGRKAFAIPLELSSRDAELLALDGIAMGDWMRLKGWDSPRLRWYVDYACRDDYGGTVDNVSAWAGVHYFAARDGSDEVLTWPEGNGFLAQGLARGLGARLRTGKLVVDVRAESGGVAALVLDAAGGTVERLRAQAALVCLPRYSAARVAAPLRGDQDALSGFTYGPWVTANLTVEGPPEGPGAPPAWDNVLYDSDSLGYVDATHQSLSQDRRRAVWTYYLPLAAGDANAHRRAMLETPWAEWRERILGDLERSLPDLRARVRRLDVMLLGHGMIRPAVDFLWGRARREAARARGPIFFGHSDLSGISIFEEAQYQGVRAAEAALKRLGRSFTSSL